MKSKSRKSNKQLLFKHKNPVKMKKISAVWMAGLFIITALVGAKAQTAKPLSVDLQPYPLTITYTKTTSLVFPYAIRSVDRGSRDILAQKTPGVENILQLKAAKRGFAETSLTVVTADGKLYPYTVSYSELPPSLNLLFGNTNTSAGHIAVFDDKATNDVIASNARNVIDRERTVKGIKDHKYDITLEVTGLYVHNDVFYVQLRLANHSSIDYDVQSLRFFVKDRKRSKRTASQALELTPLYVRGDANHIAHACTQNLCIALSKFTIPDKKYCELEMMEKDGGRNLSVRLKNKRLIHAAVI